MKLFTSKAIFDVETTPNSPRLSYFGYKFIKCLDTCLESLHTKANYCDSSITSEYNTVIDTEHYYATEHTTIHILEITISPKSCRSLLYFIHRTLMCTAFKKFYEHAYLDSSITEKDRDLLRKILQQHLQAKGYVKDSIGQLMLTNIEVRTDYDWRGDVLKVKLTFL